MPVLKADYSSINYEEMAKSIGLKPNYIPLLIASFSEESISILNALEDSIESKNYEKIKSNAHSLKGSAGNLRFNEIYEMSKEVEHSAAQQNPDFNYKAYLEAIKSAIATIPN
jgi:HPt (histidine-containing phosphotransfer) domain-containing protein